MVLRSVQGECVQEIKAHDGAINDMQFSADGIFIITSSSDNTAKLWDASTLNHLKTYTTARPVNSASISPVMHHIALGGGQEASQVPSRSLLALHTNARIQPCKRIVPHHAR